MKTIATKLLSCEVTSWSAVGSTSNIHHKTKASRVFSSCCACSEVRFSAVYGVIPRIFQQLWQGSYQCCAMPIVSRCHRVGLYAIAIPCGWHHLRVVHVGFYVIVEGPIGNLMACRIHAREQRTARRRRNSRSISLCELHPSASQLLHVGCAITTVEQGFFFIKRHRSLLPTHVVNKK